MKDKKLIITRITGSIAIVINIIMLVIVYKYNQILFYVILPLLIIVLFVGILSFLKVKRNSFYFLRYIAKRLNTNDTDILSTFPIPVAVYTNDRKFMWGNDLFIQQVISGYESKIEREQDIIQYNFDKACTQNGIQVKIDNSYFQMYGTKSPIKDTDVYVLYFMDITQLKKTEYEYTMSKPSVIKILLDNYEEVLKNIKESERSRILGGIDDIMERFINSTNGFLRKLERDQFIAVIEKRHLDELIKGRFKILDEARQLETGGLYPMTLSIGVGKEAKDLAESEHFASQALDMALGRGGDQAAVKTSDGYDFYGGVAQSIEKRTKVKTRIIAQALHELIIASDCVMVMGHRFSDLDCVGAAVGMAGAIKATGRKSYIVVDYEKSLSTSLINKLKNNESGFYKDMFISPVDAFDVLTNNTLLIIVDTHSPTFVESAKLYKAAQQVVVIDHHRKMVNYINDAVIFYHETFASSASEMVTELIQYLPSKYKIGKPEAEALLAGIMLDTRTFVIRTGVRTFEAAAYLRRLGADTVTVRKFFAGTMDSYQRKSSIVSNADIYRDCAISMTQVEFADIRVVAPQAADEMLGLADVHAAFVIYPVGNIVNISARSLGEINVQVIMESLKGGGHQTMAATQLADINIEDAKNMLVEAIDEYYATKN